MEKRTFDEVQPEVDVPSTSCLVKTPEFSPSMHTTQTVIFEYEGEPNLVALGQTLPLTMVTMKKEWGRGTKPKLDAKTLPEKGCIYSIRDTGFFRGLWGPPFKNSVMVDVSLGTKSVNVKISARKFHVCGLTSKEQGIELLNTLIGYANQAQAMIRWFNEHPTLTEELFRALESSAGEEITVNTYTIVKVNIRNKMKDRRIKTGTTQMAAFVHLTAQAMMQRCPELPEPQAAWLEGMFRECVTAQDARDRVAVFRRVFPGEIHKKPLVLNPVAGNVMMNCKYSLGFPVNRQKLLTMINNLKVPGVVARYNNAIDYYVSVEIQCTQEELTNSGVIVSRKKVVVPNTFIVYQSGHVMQSSRVYEGMLSAFYRFRAIIESIKQDIQWGDVGEKVVFTSKETIPWLCKEEAAECVVCIAAYESGQPVLRLPCAHHGHAGCLNTWFNNNTSCPVCRLKLI